MGFVVRWETSERPKALSPKEQRDEIDRDKALNAVPIGTRVGEDLIDRGDFRTFVGEVVGFRATCWQVKYGDRDWEICGPGKWGQWRKKKARSGARDRSSTTDVCR